MKNPLRKRYVRELKSDFGKYLVIFLFMVMLIGLVSGYLVSADSIETTFYEGYEKYNVEDGHITFSKEPDQEILDSIAEKSDLIFYDLQFAEEDIEGNGATLRIYPNRTEINTACVMSGELPEAKDEIAIDRVFAVNNSYEIGDEITLNGKSYRITGLIALVDYGCLFENVSDMMFNAVNFGVATMSDEGYSYLNSNHISSNYAWLYDERPADKVEENEKSEDLLDVLEDEIKAYDTVIIQAQVDELYDRADELKDDLQKQFDQASDEIEDKMETAAKDAYTDSASAIPQTKLLELYTSGADAEAYLEAAADAKGTTKMGLIAEELGTTEKALQNLDDTIDDFDTDMDAEMGETERPVVNLDDVDESYDNEMDFSLDSIRDLVAKIDATGLYDTAKITEDLDEIDELMNFEFDESDFLEVSNYMPRYENKAITYCMDDMGSDRPMFIVFDYLVVVIIAFVFAVTISNTLTAESSVIGTLRASGYSRGQLIRHYIFLPIVVTLIASVVGNVLGYTVFVEMMKSVFYTSFSLPTYVNMFNLNAFIDTTVIPIILMIVINLFVLTRRMRLSPMQFLRHESTKKPKKRAMLLNKKIKFMTRFRLRILFQNIPTYITLFVGIFFGAVIAIFGWMFVPLLDDYAELIESSQISTYQYVLKDEIETDTSGAEKFCVTSLDSMKEGYITDEISIYGIEKDSEYITTEIPDGEVLISNGMADKFNIQVGETFELKDPYSDKTYEFKAAGIYKYDAALAVFMDRSEFNTFFDEDEDHFSGYFSNEEITDIESKDIATVITKDDLTKVSAQMKVSMGEFMSLFKYFGVIMFILLMYLLTKQIIERNMQSISMTKILGFTDSEIAKLYLVITSIVVLASLAISVPLTYLILYLLFKKFIYMEMSGYIPYIVSNMCYVKMVVAGILSYLFVCFFMMRKIGKIPKSEALKNVE